MSSSSYTFPGVGLGQTLVSTALSPQAISTALQSLTVTMLGIDPTTDTAAYSKVRIDFPTKGDPAWGIGDDVCLIKAIEEDSAYNRVRDRVLAPNDETTVLATDTYVRVWRVTWTFYGPNSFDHARLLKSALFSFDFAHDALLASNLVCVTDFPAPMRAPELFQGQWWERTDFSLRLNEAVTETVTIPTIASAEVQLWTAKGEVADLTIT